MAEIPAHDLPVAAFDRSRLVPLQGALNFRDVGGQPTSDGRVLRRGLVFRADNLRDLTPQDVQTVASLGLKVVHDFRLDHERDEYPSRLPDPAPEVLLLSTGDMPEQGTSIVAMIMEMLEGTREIAPATFWEAHYARLLDDAQPVFVALMESLAGADRLPALFHCMGGKDRTGLAATLLQSILGVPEELILDDLLATNELRTMHRYAFWAPKLRAKNVDPLAALPILGVTRSAWVHARTHLADTYGGALGYLVAGGMEPALADVLTAKLVGDRP